ncbi:MAG: methyltransferase domain-containing protein [Nanoarchaeota archaeon]
MKIPNTEKVWNKVASPWKEVRKKPVEEVINFLKTKKGKILDLGCGSGRNFTKVDGVIYGVDFSENMLKYAKSLAKERDVKVKLTKSRAENLPFKDNFFDAAIFVATLHCIPKEKERKKALQELYRVLKKGKEAIITVWDKNQEKFKNAEKEVLLSWKQEGKEYRRYYYLYEKDEIEKLVKSVGFKIKKVIDWENPEFFYSKKNIILVVEKP